MNSPNKEPEEEIIQIPPQTERKTISSFQKNINNFMNDVTIDDTSVLSQNRSVDIGSSSQRMPLIEDYSRRRVSILKQSNFNESQISEMGSVKKKPTGKKIQFVLE